MPERAKTAKKCVFEVFSSKLHLEKIVKVRRKEPMKAYQTQRNLGKFSVKQNNVIPVSLELFYPVK